MKRVLVTGASGFVGRQALGHLLLQGYEVHAVDLRCEAKSHDETHWHRVDLFEAKQIRTLIATIKPTHLLHFAWYVSPGKYTSSPENIRWVQASLELLQVFASHNGKRAVMAGSCMEYDWRYGYCSERVTPLMPTTLYGICKHSLQTILAAFAAEMELSTAWGRIFFLYGPHEHPDRLVAYVIRCFLKGELAHCSEGFQMRDFLHVADVASAFVKLLESDVRGPVNIASGHPVAIREVVGKIATKMDREDLVKFGTVISRPDEAKLVVGDTSRLFGEVGWSPEFDLDKGLEHTIDWWKNHYRNRVGP